MILKLISIIPTGAMLKNFLEALEITGAAKNLRRVILTAGAKQYGVHLGPPKNPMEESDPWIDGPDRLPNFYYHQQNILKEKAKNASWDWVVTYPNDVIGVAKGNFMNLATSVGLYASISKELNGTLLFPGSEKFYMYFDCFTYSRLHASFNLWAAQEPKCSNQAFNIVNGDTESWQNMWPKLARRFGCKIPANQFEVDVGKEAGSVMPLAEKPPIAEIAAELGLEDRVGQGKVEQRIDLIKWSQRDDVKEAWGKLASSHGLEKDAFEKATWGFLGFVLGRDYNLVISMSKARKLGWTGYVINILLAMSWALEYEFAMLMTIIATSIRGIHYANAWMSWRRRKFFRKRSDVCSLSFLCKLLYIMAQNKSWVSCIFVVERASTLYEVHPFDVSICNLITTRRFSAGPIIYLTSSRKLYGSYFSPFGHNTTFTSYSRHLSATISTSPPTSNFPPNPLLNLQ